MLVKSFTGLVVPESTSRFGTIGEGIHHVVILDAIRMPQNQKCTLSDAGKIILGAMKDADKVMECFNQEVTTIVFQEVDGTAVIFDHRSDFGFAKRNEPFTSRKTGEVMILDDALINKLGLKEFQGKFYLPAKGTRPDTAIEDAAKETDCFQMLSRVYAAAGLTGQGFDPSALIGRDIKIKVEVNGYSRPGDKFERFKVTGWYKPDETVTTTKQTNTPAPVVDSEDDDLPF